jgi:hypothetical protein
MGSAASGFLEIDDYPKQLGAYLTRWSLDLALTS